MPGGSKPHYGEMKGELKMRWFIAIAFGAALAVSMPSMSVDAAGKKAKSKMCTGTDIVGKKVSFKCGATDKCCFDWLTGQGTCVPASGTCL
jgi:hypothetical protein